MRRLPPSPTLTDTLFPYTTRFRSTGARGCGAVAVLRHRYSGGGNNQRHGCRDVQAMAAVAARTANVDRIGRSLDRHHPHPHFPCGGRDLIGRFATRSEEHTSELQSLMRISYAVFCLKKKKNT